MYLSTKNGSPNSESFYAAIFNSIGSPILIIDSQTAAILDANEAACKFYGYSHADFIQKKILDLAAIPVEEASQFIQKIAAGEIAHLTLPHRLANGEIREVEVGLDHSEFENKPINIATVHDITKQKQAEQSLYMSEQKYRGFVSQANEAFTLVDEQGVVIEWNPASEQLTGIPASEVLGQFVWDVQLRVTSAKNVTEEMREQMRQRIQDVLKTGSGALLGTYETEIKHSGGASIITAQKLFIIKTNEGFQIGTIARDITRERHIQERLKASEERYRLLFDNMREGFSLYEVIKDENGTAIDARILAANAAYELHTRLKPVDVIGRTILEAVPQTSLSQLEPYFKVAQTGEPISLEYFSVAFQRHFHTETFCPQPGQFATIVEDITERKNAESALQSAHDELELRVQERTVELRRSLERLNLATDAANMGIWDWDIQKNELVWDQQMYTLYGVKPESFGGAYEAWLNGIHPDDRETSEQASEQALKGATPYDTEFRVLWPDGTVRWLKTDGQVFWDEQGKPIRMLGVNYDITERKQAEEKLRKMSYLLTEGQKIAHLGSFEYLVATQQTIWSEEQFRIYGYDSSQSAPDLNTILSKSIHPDDAGFISQTFQTAIQNGGVYELEHRIIYSDGSTHWVHEIAQPDFDQTGQIIRYVGVSLDITERKKAEQKLLETNNALEKALQTKDEFLAAMNHELRTPLTGIIGIAELLQIKAENTMSEKQLKHIATIQTGGQRLLDMVNNILTYTQLQGGNLKPDNYMCLLDQVCKVALQQVGLLAGKKQQHLQYSVTPHDIKILTDEVRLHKILSLLLDNASKFTATGGEFGIEVTGRLDAGLVDIAVWDTGIGIVKEDFPRLFKPFTQLDASLARQYEGAGLGLALVKSITELLNGTVSVQSTLGKGSRFIVTLPWK